jgi:MFS family permease
MLFFSEIVRVIKLNNAVFINDIKQKCKKQRIMNSASASFIHNLFTKINQFDTIEVQNAEISKEIYWIRILKHLPTSSPWNKAVLIAGLGFFVDAFDLLLFNVIRLPSLIDLGYSGAALTQHGAHLLSLQMAGMMIGGIGSGLIADRLGRSKILLGSILLYSLANIANALVTDVHQYGVVRFIAGIGLAGELGAGIALVGERMHAQHRGRGTVLVAAMGGLGAVFAGLCGDLLYWRYTFALAGIFGLLLLLLRSSQLESSVFKSSIAQKTVPHGNLFLLFKTRERTWRFIKCILIGVPIWYCVGMLVAFAPEQAKEFNVTVNPVLCFILFQVGITSGDLLSGLVSQYWQSRKKALLLFMTLAVCTCIFWFVLMAISASGTLLAVAAALMGLGCGYLSVYVTTVSELFGTNLRVTATSGATNFMRGSVALLLPLNAYMQKHIGISMSLALMLVGIAVWTVALLSLKNIDETFGRDLGFEEKAG